MKKRMVVTIYIVCGTVTVRLGIDKSVRNSQSNGPVTAKKKNKQTKQNNQQIYKPKFNKHFVVYLLAFREEYSGAVVQNQTKQKVSCTQRP